MLNAFLNKQKEIVFWSFALASIIGLMGGFYLENYLFMAVVPAVAIFSFITLVNFRIIFYLLMFCLPLGFEVVFGGFGTDLPSEPLMIFLMLIYIVYALFNPKVLEQNFYTHPIIIVLLLHYAWIFFSALHSINLLVSIKFFLAKTWYIATFLLLAPLIINSKKAFLIFFWCMFIPLMFTAFQSNVRLFLLDFDFEFINDCVTPFFRNHVSYGAMLTSFLPFVFVAAATYKQQKFLQLFLWGSIIFIVLSIYLSYTRMCYIGLVMAAISYFLIKLKLMRWMLPIALISVGAILTFYVNNNNFLKLSPTFEKTITHDNFEDLIEATFDGEDASSMERLYRWVAAFYMFDDSKWLGHGPGNFYPTYKKYTVTEFTTYLSDNDEKSTVHNYFLLLLVEQGIIGLLIFLTLTVLLFILGERMYHTAKNDFNKYIIMGCLLSLITAYVNLMFNDMIEVDKTGSLFFMSIALLVSFSVCKTENNIAE